MTTPGDLLSGRCLCGGVTFTARLGERHADACHCTMCQRWNGGIPVSAMARDLVFTGGDLGVYRSSDWGERVFCRTCGSSLAWRMQDGSAAAVAEAAFDPPLDLPLAMEIFIEDKPAGYDFAGERKRLTGEEAVALFTGTPQTELKAD
jgi:hypothetical protein